MASVNEPINEPINGAEFDKRSLFAWMQTISRQTLFNVHDGYQIAQILQMIIPTMKLDEIIEEPKDLYQRFINWNIILTNLLEFYQDSLQLIILMKLPNLYILSSNICSDKEKELELLMLLIVSCAVQSDQRAYFIDCIKQLDIQQQLNIMQKIKTLVEDKEKIMCREDWIEICNRENTNVKQFENYYQYKFVKNLSEERKYIFIACRQLIKEHLENGKIGVNVLKSPCIEENFFDKKIKQLQEAVNFKCEEMDDLVCKLDNLNMENIKLKSQNVDLLKEASTMKVYRDELDICREQLLQLARVEKENLQLRCELKESASVSCNNFDIHNSTCLEPYSAPTTPDQQLPLSVNNHKDLQRQNWRLEQQLELCQQEVTLLQQKLQELSTENAQYELLMSTKSDCLCLDNNDNKDNLYFSNNSYFNDSYSYFTDVLMNQNAFNKGITTCNYPQITNSDEVKKHGDKGSRDLKKVFETNDVEDQNNSVSDEVNIDEIVLETPFKNLKFNNNSSTQSFAPHIYEKNFAIGNICTLKNGNNCLDESISSDKPRCSIVSSSSSSLSFAHRNDSSSTSLSHQNANAVNNYSPVNSIKSLSNKRNGDCTDDITSQICGRGKINFEELLFDTNSIDEIAGFTNSFFSSSSKEVEDLSGNSINKRETMFYKDVIVPQLVLKMKHLKHENKNLLNLLSLAEQKLQKSTYSNHQLLTQYQALCWMHKRVEDEEEDMKKKLANAMDKNHQLLSQLISYKDQCSEEQKNHLKEMSELRYCKNKLEDEIDKKRKNSKKRNWILHGFIKKKKNLLKDKCGDGLFLDECVSLNQFLEESNHCSISSFQNDDCLMKEDGSGDGRSTSINKSSNFHLVGLNKDLNKRKTLIADKMAHSLNCNEKRNIGNELNVNDSLKKYLYPYSDNLLSRSNTINGPQSKTRMNNLKSDYMKELEFRRHKTEAKGYHLKPNGNSRDEILNDSTFSRSFSLRNYTITDKQNVDNENIKTDKLILNGVHVKDEMRKDDEDLLLKNKNIYDSSVEKTLTELSAACWNINSTSNNSHFNQNINQTDNGFKKPDFVGIVNDLSNIKNNKTSLKVEIDEGRIVNGIPNRLENKDPFFAKKNGGKMVSNNEKDLNDQPPVVILDKNKNNLSPEDRLSLLLKDPIFETKKTALITPRKIYRLPIGQTSNQMVGRTMEQKSSKPTRTFIQSTTFTAKNNSYH